MQQDRYISPFETRYASKEMQYLFSPDHKFKTWRRLWVALARAEQKQGLAITNAQIAELERYQNDINYDVAEAREKEVRHDVMSHARRAHCQRRAVCGKNTVGAAHHQPGTHRQVCKKPDTELR